jgi:hypothetical protein
MTTPEAGQSQWLAAQPSARWYRSTVGRAQDLSRPRSSLGPTECHLRVPGCNGGLLSAHRPSAAATVRRVSPSAAPGSVLGQGSPPPARNGRDARPRQDLALPTLSVTACTASSRLDAVSSEDPEFLAASSAKSSGAPAWRCRTRRIRDIGQDGADVVLEAPVPRWGWGVAPPYIP